MKLLREPLVHFLLLGAALFAVSTLRGGGGDRGSTEIVVGEAELASRLESWQIVWQRPPSRSELEGLVEDFVREEVLVREALARRLDEGDSVVRQRLRQKMEFLAQGIDGPREPTDAELAEFLKDNAGRFEVEGRAEDLEEVREQVAREWKLARQKETADGFYRSLREKYEVRIELPEPEEE